MMDAGVDGQGLVLAGDAWRRMLAGVGLGMCLIRVCEMEAWLGI